MNRGTGGGRATMGSTSSRGGAGGTTLHTIQALAQANTDTLLLSGLSGNVAKTYRVLGTFGVTGGGSLKVQPNSADTNAQSLAGEKITDGRSIVEAAAMIFGAQFGGAINIWNAGDTGVITGSIQAATGRGSRYFALRAIQIRTGAVINVRLCDGVWIDSTTPLTSIKFLGSSATFFTAGSQITVTEEGI